MMTQQLICIQPYDNNDTSSRDTSPTLCNNDKCITVDDMSPLSSLSHFPDVCNKVNSKMPNNDCQSYYDYYYNYNCDGCYYVGNVDNDNDNDNNNNNNNDNYINIDNLTLNDYIEDDNVSECNSLGNATFVPAPFLYLNHDSNENENVASFGYGNCFTTNFFDKNNDIAKNMENVNENVCDVVENQYNNNSNKEKKRRMNFVMMPVSDLQYTLDEILNMNVLLYYTTNIEGSKLIQYLLDNEENNGKKISNATFDLFNKQLLSKDESGNTIGLIMCCNIYGNYVMQKYLSVAPFHCVDEIITEIICPNAFQLAFDKHGCRVLQFAISNNNNNKDHNNNNNSDDTSNKNNSDNGSVSNNDLQNDNNIDNEFKIHNTNHNGMHVAMKKLNVYCYHILYYITLQNHLLECIANVSVNHIVQKCINHLNNNANGNNDENINNINTKMMTNCIMNTESDNDDYNEDEDESVTKLSSKMKHKLLNMMLIQMQCKLFEFSLHKYGCRIVQSLLDFGNAEQKNFIIQTLIPHLVALSCDKYGNYVIQKIMFYNRVLVCNQNNIKRSENKHNDNDTMSTLIANFYQLCLNKYGSNVAELCYQYSNETQKQAIIQQLTSYHHNDSRDKISKKYNNQNDKDKMLMIISLIKHEYGNYVVQKIINLSNDKQKYLLLGVIKKHLSYLKHQIYKFPSIKLFVKNFFPSSK